MRVAIIGAGLQARRRGAAIRNSPNDELVVITAAHSESSARLAATLGCAAATGWRETVMRNDIDAVIVATPPHLHSEIAIDALSHGKDVLCEKPLARNEAETELMIAAAERSGRKLWCGFNHRFHPAVQRVRAWTTDGSIGVPRLVRARYGICGRPGYEHEWRADPRIVGGGQLMEQGIHVVDLARWFLGEFVRVSGMTGTLYWPIAPLEDNAFACLQTADGAMAQIHASLTQWRNMFEFEVFGTEGYAIASGLGGSYGTETARLGKREFGVPFAETSIEYRGEDVSWHEEWVAFRSCDATTALASARDGLEAIRTVRRVYDASVALNAHP